ncbi:MAG: ferritin-like domain-containing protein, partial [Myxococcota bacterium]
AITAQVLQWGIRFGLPRDLLDTAHRIVRDELDHAELSHRCMVALGGSPEALTLDESDLAPPLDPAGPLVSLLKVTVENYCFGETLAVPLFSAMRAQTRLPVAREALDRILRDEAVHRAFGWQTLTWLTSLDHDGVYTWVAHNLGRIEKGYEKAYGHVEAASPLTPAEEAVGLLSPQRYRDIFGATLTQDIRPRFHRLGLLPAR